LGLLEICEIGYIRQQLTLLFSSVKSGALQLVVGVKKGKLYAPVIPVSPAFDERP
jgi:hypothetical protein